MTPLGFRVEAIARAFLIAGCGMAIGVSIVVRCLAEAIDAAVTLPRPSDVPDTVPAAWSEMHL